MHVMRCDAMQTPRTPNGLAAADRARKSHLIAWQCEPWRCTVDAKQKVRSRTFFVRAWHEDGIADVDMVVEARQELFLGLSLPAVVWHLCHPMAT